LRFLESKITLGTHAIRLFLFFNLLATLAKLTRPGGARSVVAENLLLKQQLIIHSRSRQRAPNLTTLDRTVLGFLSLFLRPRRLVRSAVIIRPSTLLAFHNTLKKRKYRLLYSNRGGRKPGPKEATKEVIRAIYAPQADRLPSDDDSPFSQDIFDIAVTEVESIVEPNGIGNDVRWNLCRL
jgi:hypothetical protein